MVFFLPCVHHSLAQSAWQSWNSADIIYPFANSYSFDGEVSYQTIIVNQAKWRSLSFTPTFETSVSQHLDLIVAVPLSYTWQKETVETSEIRLSFGSRLHIAPNKRLLTRLLIRYEPRFVYQEEESDWQKSNRLRVRLEAVIPINRKTYFENKVLYGLIDYEQFFAKNNTVNERFANRFRTRTGMGYRFTYQVRIELIFIMQRSRSTLETPYNTTDNILHLRLKYFLHEGLHTKQDGTGI